MKNVDALKPSRLTIPEGVNRNLAMREAKTQGRKRGGSCCTWGGNTGKDAGGVDLHLVVSSRHVHCEGIAKNLHFEIKTLPCWRTLRRGALCWCCPGTGRRSQRRQSRRVTRSLLKAKMEARNYFEKESVWSERPPKEVPCRPPEDLKSIRSHELINYSTGGHSG